MRKKILAASFVVTVLGCNRDADKPTIHTNNPPAPETPTSTPTSTPTAPPPEDPDVRIEKMDDGTCMRFVKAGPCPPGAMCNPPPPMKVPCPDAGTSVTPTPKKDPTPDYIKNCPPGAKCNPPPPGM